MCNTLLPCFAASTLIILLLGEKIQIKILVKENMKNFKKILFIKMIISQLISYLTNMCESCQGTMVAI
jgi:hypothetical protein